MIKEGNRAAGRCPAADKFSPFDRVQRTRISTVSVFFMFFTRFFPKTGDIATRLCYTRAVVMRHAHTSARKWYLRRLPQPR